jgi:hypothetical protein
MRAWKQIWKLIVISVFLVSALPSLAWAAQSTSPNYSVDQVFFGSGGELNACSTSFCSKQSAGETSVGNTSSTNFQAQAGFNTNRSESLTFVVTNANINLGTLLPGTTYTASATFSVKTYLSNGYQVRTISPPPSNGAHNLNTTASAVISNPNSEQFGINLVANSTACGAPVNFGAGPIQIPDASFSFGAAAAGYDTCGRFKYGVGDVIASSARSSGETDYTMSYIFNTSNVTPAGTYTMNHTLVATGYY